MSKLAFLTPTLPYPPTTGGTIRAYHLIREFARHHEVHVITVRGQPSPDAISALVHSGVQVQPMPIPEYTPAGIRQRIRRKLSPVPDHVAAFTSPASMQDVQRYLTTHHFDIQIADEIVMAPYVMQQAGIQRLLFLQNIDYQLQAQRLRYQSGFYKKAATFYEYLRLRAFSRRVLRQRWDTILLCSEADRAAVQRFHPSQKTCVMPNGVDFQYYQAVPKTTPEMPTLLFIGSMFYEPNIDGILYFFEQIYPQIAARIDPLRVLVVGHHPPPVVTMLAQRFPHVIITGSVPDVRDYLAQADAVIVPIRMGGGTSLKVIEGLAADCPVISTAIGCRGLHLEPERDLLVADQPVQFAQQVIRVLTDQLLRQKLIVNGRQAARRYDWAALTETLYRDCWQSTEEAIISP